MESEGRPEEVCQRDKRLEEKLEKAQKKLETQLQEMSDEDLMEGLIEIANIQKINFDNPATSLAFLIQNQVIMSEAIIRIQRRHE